VRTSNQIRSDISVVGRGLNNENIKYIWGGVPSGAHAAFSFEKNAILLPILDQEILTEEQVNNLMAWDRHERLHALKSCGDYMKKKYGSLNKLEQHLFQRLEDSRIETGNSSMSFSEMESLRIHGEKNIVQEETGRDECLRSFRMNEFKDVCKDYIKIAHNNRWGYLSMALQFKVANYGDFPIPEELQKFFDIGWKILSDGRFKKSRKTGRAGTWTIGELTKEVIKAWDIEDSKEENNSKDNNENESNKDGEEKEEEGENGEKGEEDDNESISEEFITSNKDDDSLDPNKLGLEVGQMSLDQEEKKVKPLSMNLPYNMEDEDLIPNEFPNEFFQICSQITDKAQELRGILTVILRSRTRTQVNKNRLHGKINHRSLSSVSCGNTKIMQKTKEGINLNTDIQIIIDLSGSMWYSTYKEIKRSTLAACVAITLTEALSNVYGINVEVIGFNSVTPKHPENIQPKMQRSHDKILTHFFKTFDENYYSVKNRLGAMAVTLEKGGAVGGANVDHEVIWRGAHRLLKRGKKRKIQLVLSDGIPSGCGGTYNGFLETELTRVNNKIKTTGIEQVAIGIQNNGVELFYPRTLVLYELDKLDQEALKLVADLLLKN